MMRSWTRLSSEAMLKIFLAIFLLNILNCDHKVESAFEDLSSTCKNQFIFFNDALLARRDWALKMFDTWGKFQHSVLDGNVNNFGDYDLCRSFVHESPVTSIGTVNGEYCLVSYIGAEEDIEPFDINFDWKELGSLARSQNLYLTTGICLPKSCTKKDVDEIANIVFSNANLNVTSVSCESKPYLRFSNRLLAVFIFIGLLITVIASTVYELFMIHRDSEGKFNLIKIYLHRFLRYTPVLLFLVLFFMSFMQLLGSGPIFERTLEDWLPNCYNYWWSTLLHIATYTNIDNLCLNWTWYLSADFQLFLVSPILIYPAWRWKWKIFAVAFPIAMLSFLIYIFVVSITYEFLVFVGPLQSQGQFDYDRLLYYPTHARAGPWIIGMALGFIMYQLKGIKPHINKYLATFLWVASFSLLTVVVLGYFPFQQADEYFTINKIVNASYNAFYRSGWALSLAWIIFACHNGYGGIINWFLSLPQFQPLARMSLSVYLSHRIFQIISVATIRQPIYLSPFNLLHVYFGDVIMSLIVGIAVYLCIEAPFAVLEARLSGDDTKKN
ncbi:CLUMA_CG019121, isoform A [Clunio marinus]|uniref:CLUMA_CG019121, isoform A n=1 Tax=Clunio marinus TaxID=568069 RepID=A0A1J1J4I8_9DIPT|nr:CLUMA_CG019121, isoform A [Clunio marinus]